MSHWLCTCIFSANWCVNYHILFIFLLKFVLSTYPRPFLVSKSCITFRLDIPYKCGFWSKSTLLSLLYVSFSSANNCNYLLLHLCEFINSGTGAPRKLKARNASGWPDWTQSAISSHWEGSFFRVHTLIWHLHTTQSIVPAYITPVDTCLSDICTQYLFRIARAE